MVAWLLERMQLCSLVTVPKCAVYAFLSGEYAGSVENTEMTKVGRLCVMQALMQAETGRETVLSVHPLC